MLKGRRDCFLSNPGRLAKFQAEVCGIAAAHAPPPGRGVGTGAFSLTHNGVNSGIHLESAAFVFHMMGAA